MKLPKSTYDNRYQSVLKLVKDGKTISEACSELKLHRIFFYFKLSEEQKNELKTEKLKQTFLKREST